PVHWVDIQEPNPAETAIASQSVYQQGFVQGGATFARLEGCCSGSDSIFFTSTTGGNKKLGQVWQYIPQDDKQGALKLIFESREEAVLDMPDNICVSPRGGLVICEDGDNHQQYIRGLTREGGIFDFARNIVPGFEKEEFAGATFSPDGKTLFV